MAQDEAQAEMSLAMMKYMPLRSLYVFGGEMVSEDMLLDALKQINKD